MAKLRLLFLMSALTVHLHTLPVENNNDLGKYYIGAAVTAALCLLGWFFDTYYPQAPRTEDYAASKNKYRYSYLEAEGRKAVREELDRREREGRPLFAKNSPHYKSFEEKTPGIFDR